MASSQEFVRFVCARLNRAGTIEFVNLFGDYGLYCDGKSIGLIRDDCLYLKPTEPGKRLLGRFLEEVVLTEGGKPYYRIDYLDDEDELVELVRATWSALPESRSRKRRQQTAEPVCDPSDSH